ncbi:MAG: phage minor capsid protein [Lachnospiraceae bacterium]|nr:phage minor capsid protein [Lachnospiraceae bacterium]
MLTPDYLEQNADILLDYYRDLENYIIHDIAMRLLKAGEMSGMADYELWKLEQMGMHRAEILKKLSQITGKSTAELRKLLQDAVLTSWEGDAADFSRMGIILENPLENPAVISIMDAQWKKTQGELSNLTRTTMLQSQNDLVSLLNQADMRIASGVQSTSAAICEILDQYAGRGVVIRYPSGTTRSLEAAVRCCVVTSANQTAAQVTNHYIAKHGIEYVLVSAHLGARHNEKHPEDLYSHDWWQGKAYKIRGSEQGFPNLLDSTGYDIRDGVGIVENPNGLHGYNCRHSHEAWDKEWENPWLDADGKPRIDQEESRKQYSLSQKQRSMEREIRKTKRQLLVKQAELDAIAETDVRDIIQPEYDKLAYKLRMQNKQYNDFCGKNDLRTQSERVKVAGFKRQQSAIARGRATAYQNSLKKQI